MFGLRYPLIELVHEHVRDAMTKWYDLREFCKNGESYDYIVLNAGGMPSNLVLNEYKFEHQCTSQLLGHYFLIHLLSEFNKINKDARIVWISSFFDPINFFY